MAKQPNNNVEDKAKNQQPEDDSEAELDDQDPGERQKRNQGDEKDDPLAA